MPTSHPTTVSTTVAGKSFTASASPPQSNLVERVYRIIDDLCIKASGPVWLSQKELAQTLEVTPRTINRVISRLKQSGRLAVTKTGSDMSYLTAREPAQLPMVSAITAPPSPRARSSVTKPVSPPQPATPDRPEMDSHATTDSQPVDSDTTGNRQPMDNRWTANGQPIDDPETPDSQPVDNLATADRQPMDSPDGNQAAITWKQTLAEISNQLPLGSFRNFFATTAGIEFNGDYLVVAVQSARAVEWLERPLHQEIAHTTLQHVTGRELRIKYLEDPMLAGEVQRHTDERSPKTSPAPPDLSPCPRCGADTMTLTTWPSLRRLPGQTYYCRGAGACSRLWNSVVGEFHPPGEEQLDPEAARNLLSRVLQNRPRSHH